MRTVYFDRNYIIISLCKQSHAIQSYRCVKAELSSCALWLGNCYRFIDLTGQIHANRPVRRKKKKKNCCCSDRRSLKFRARATGACSQRHRSDHQPTYLHSINDHRSPPAVPVKGGRPEWKRRSRVWNCRTKNTVSA